MYYFSVYIATHSFAPTTPTKFRHYCLNVYSIVPECSRPLGDKPSNYSSLMYELTDVEHHANPILG